MWTWFVRFIISGITFHHDANKLYDYSFLEFKGLHLHLKVDVVERKAHLPVLESNWVPRSSIKPRNVDNYSILLVYLPLKGILGNAVYTGVMIRHDQHRN